MNGLIAALGFVVGGLLGFLAGRKIESPTLHEPRGNRDTSLFVTTPGTDGFCKGQVRKLRMKGRSFHWRREGFPPASGSHFEIRLKDTTRPSPLVPAVPAGVNDILADVKSTEPPKGVYEYSVFQVLANGDVRELHDPELEIGQI